MMAKEPDEMLGEEADELAHKAEEFAEDAAELAAHLKKESGVDKR